jgi:exonuclease VII large subunit
LIKVKEGRKKVSKQRKIVLLFFGILVSILWALPALADKGVEKLEVVYHQRMAKKYERRIDQQEKEIEKHKDFLEEYRKQSFIDKESQGFKKSAEQMQRHCEAIISLSQQLKTEYEKFAKWHQAKAVELKSH